MVLSLLIAVFLGLSPLLAASPAAPDALEDSVYIYGLFRGAPGAPSCSWLKTRLRSLPLRSTVILSVEPESGFLLDRPDGEEQLLCVLSYLRNTSRTAKALFLQDTVFLERGSEAARRAGLLGAFAARYPGLLRGAQVDVEPYASDQWCCSVDNKRALMRQLYQLLSQVRERLGGLPLGVLAPWWYPAVAVEIPKTSLETLFRVADEVYLMVYGDTNGPVVGSTAKRVLARLNAPKFFAGNGRVYVTLATYEFHSPKQLRKEIEKVRRGLARHPSFAGIAVFHAASSFNVPLQRVVSGLVTDQAGRGLPGVKVMAAGKRATSDACGNFSLRGLPAPRASLILQKDGFLTRTFPIELRQPGKQLELRSIALERNPEQKWANELPPSGLSGGCAAWPAEESNSPAGHGDRVSLDVPLSSGPFSGAEQTHRSD